MQEGEEYLLKLRQKYGKGAAPSQSAQDYLERCIFSYVAWYRV
jgi:hypothetical protein